MVLLTTAAAADLPETEEYSDSCLNIELLPNTKVKVLVFISDQYCKQRIILIVEEFAMVISDYPFIKIKCWKSTIMILQAQKYDDAP